MFPVLVRRRRAAAVLGCLGFLLIGWSSLLVPSLVRQVEAGFGEPDASVGIYYLVASIAYAVGSLAGGALTGRAGRRTVLVAALLLHGAGLLAQATIGSWSVFVLAGVPRALGMGAIDGGVNALILDLYPEARGRALNAAHLFFALGALGAPFAAGLLDQAGVAWQLMLGATALASFPLAAFFAVTNLTAPPRPSPRRRASAARRPLGLVVPLIALAVAICCYVAAEMGVSSWVVRFLEAAPLAVATSALGLFWTGLTIGRLVSARLADRVDHLTLAIVASVTSSVALVAAIVVPILPLSVALFGFVGFAFGPIYPLIMAIGGERFPDRIAAMSGVLAAAGTLGSIVYPPLMGFMSATVGLPAAMLGTAVIGLACAAALLAAGRAGRLADGRRGPLVVES